MPASSERPDHHRASGTAGSMIRWPSVAQDRLFMHPDTLSRRTIAFVNVAHALDHFVLLIYPTAVIAIAAERGLDYGALIGLATGAFVAFGLFSLPMGWLSERA